MKKTSETLRTGTPLSLADELAVERTNLANERTFLSYFRTGMALLAGGLTILRLELLSQLSTWGYLFLGLAPVVLGVGVWRYLSVKKRIGKQRRLSEAPRHGT
jgi:putative membrane protein